MDRTESARHVRDWYVTDRYGRSGWARLRTALIDIDRRATAGMGRDRERAIPLVFGDLLMMGHREKMKGGDEFDALTKARHRYKYTARAGAVKRMKRKFWQRVRAALKRILRREEEP